MSKSQFWCSRIIRKGQLQQACFARVISLFAFVVAILMAMKLVTTKRRRAWSMLIEKDHLTKIIQRAKLLFCSCYIKYQTIFNDIDFQAMAWNCRNRIQSLIRYHWKFPRIIMLQCFVWLLSTLCQNLSSTSIDRLRQEPLRSVNLITFEKFPKMCTFLTHRQSQLSPPVR